MASSVRYGRNDAHLHHLHEDSEKGHLFGMGSKVASVAGRGNFESAHKEVQLEGAIQCSKQVRMDDGPEGAPSRKSDGVQIGFSFKPCPNQARADSQSLEHRRPKLRMDASQNDGAHHATIEA